MPTCLSNTYLENSTQRLKIKTKVHGIDLKNELINFKACQLKDGSQLIQTVGSGVHRSPLSLNTLASTAAQVVPEGGFVWKSSTLCCAFKHTDEHEMQSRSTAEVGHSSSHKLGDSIFIIKVIEA